MSNPQVAKTCSAENVRLFANARTEPEKFNLYNGLAALADAIADLQAQVAEIGAHAHGMEQRLKRIEDSLNSR